MSYAKQKLCDALYSLVGSGELDARMTGAGNALAMLEPKNFPDLEDRQAFESIRKRLFKTPLSSKRSYTPRQMSEDDLEKLARDILGIYTNLMGGLA
jgi:hypothetical protein